MGADRVNFSVTPATEGDLDTMAAISTITQQEHATRCPDHFSAVLTAGRCAERDGLASHAVGDLASRPAVADRAFLRGSFGDLSDDPDAAAVRELARKAVRG